MPPIHPLLRSPERRPSPCLALIAATFLLTACAPPPAAPASPSSASPDATAPSTPPASATSTRPAPSHGHGPDQSAPRHGAAQAPHGPDAHAHDHHGHDHAAGHAHGPLVHRFERADDWTAQFDSPDRDAWQKPTDVVAAMGITPGMTVADIGAGTGYFLPHLVRAVGPTGKVLALDVEADMVRYLKERATRERLTTVQPRLVPYDDPQLQPASVDRILIVDTWHHIPDRPQYTQKLRDGLKPGGILVVVDFTETARRGPPKHHRISPDQVATELKAGGLVPTRANVDLPDQYVVLGRRP
ncbi:class I SAM-dependent methyltransferase [Chondromyces crocatus]|uniref:Methyltransferase domain-containing protein n=1 Tax=Chondromyces crocatus TaxID=52 RepID=A0A0K1EHU8_CHOCO|nr:methyltransferase [Chondromyces crocatus]AKT40451.1 uncharacterized protein CMC5_046060 [Chondromyces crocatus]